MDEGHYLREVERSFAVACGRAIPLGTRCADLAMRWRLAGVPLDVLLRAIPRAVSARAERGRLPLTLAWCADAIAREVRAEMNRAAGAAPVRGARSVEPGEAADVARRLHGLVVRLSALAQGASGAPSRFLRAALPRVRGLAMAVERDSWRAATVPIALRQIEEAALRALFWGLSSGERDALLSRARLSVRLPAAASPAARRRAEESRLAALLAARVPRLSIDPDESAAERPA